MTPQEPRPLPVLLDMRDRRAVVVGGGAASVRTVRDLLGAGAHVTVIAGVPGETGLAALGTGGLTIENRGYVRGDLLGAFLVVCFLAEEELQRAVVDEAESVGCMVNVVGVPALSSFEMPGT